MELSIHLFSSVIPAKAGTHGAAQTNYELFPLLPNGSRPSPG
jgi:hypothetical protein